MERQGLNLLRISAMLALLSAFSMDSAFASVLRVPQDYSTIQAAIDAAVDGDVIRVGPGTYPERVTISKSAIRLEADPIHQAVLDGATLAGTGAAIAILGTATSLVTDVSIVGFRVENYQGPGISLMFSDKCRVLSNIVTNTTLQSIAMARTTLATVADNDLSNGSFGVGISMRSTDNTVKENTISGAFLHGIRVSMVQAVNQPPLRNTIKENVICVDHAASQTGVLIADFASENVVKENRIVGNGVSTAGIKLDTPTTGNVVKENILSRHAIDVLDQGTDNTVTENKQHRSLKCR